MILLTVCWHSPWLFPWLPYNHSFSFPYNSFLSVIRSWWAFSYFGTTIAWKLSGLLASCYSSQPHSIVYGVSLLYCMSAASYLTVFKAFSLSQRFYSYSSFYTAYRIPKKHEQGLAAKIAKTNCKFCMVNIGVLGNYLMLTESHNTSCELNHICKAYYYDLWTRLFSRRQKIQK